VLRRSIETTPRSGHKPDYKEIGSYEKSVAERLAQCLSDDDVRMRLNAATALFAYSRPELRVALEIST